MSRLLVYSDYVCPFCYLAWPAVKALREAGREVELRSFELRPPPMPLPSAPDPQRRAAWDRYIVPRAALLGLEANFPPLQPRTRKAHEAAKHVEKLGLGTAFHDLLFRAYFVEGRDIGRIDVLVSLGESLGVSRSDLKVELDIDQYTERVEADERLGQELGISAVPAYVVVEPEPRVHTGLLTGTELGQWLDATDVKAAGSHETEEE